MVSKTAKEWVRALNQHHSEERRVLAHLSSEHLKYVHHSEQNPSNNSHLGKAHTRGCHHSAAAHLLLASQDRLLLAVIELLFAGTDGTLQEHTSGITANTSAACYMDIRLIRLAGL